MNAEHFAGNLARIIRRLERRIDEFAKSGEPQTRNGIYQYAVLASKVDLLRDLGVAPHSVSRLERLIETARHALDGKEVA